MDAAAGVLVGSRHTAESLWEAIGDPDLPVSTRLGPPGVDTDLFRPLAREAAPERLAELAATVAAAEAGGGAFARDARAAADAIRHLAAAQGPRVVLVGKLIVSKGVDLLLAAWPLVHAANPGARLLVVGFGEYAGALQRLWAALAGGDLERGSRSSPPQGRALEGGPRGPASDAGLLPGGSARRATGGRARRRRLRRLRRSARARGGRRADAGHRRLGDPRAPSPRPSAWSPPRRRPRASCRYPRPTPALRRSAEFWRPRCRAEVAELLSFPVDEGAVRGDRRATQRAGWRWTSRPAIGPAALAERRGAALELGARGCGVLAASGAGSTI